MSFFCWNRTAKVISLIMVAAIIAVSVGLFVIWKNVDSKKSLSLTAWISDWDYQSGIQDLKSIQGSLSELQIFAAYFDYRDNLYFTEEFNRLTRCLLDMKKEGNNPVLYLTIVNDRFDENGKPIQKDPLLLSRLMTSEETRQRHMDEIIAAVRSRGFDGVEIDYEKIPPEMWKSYASFCEQLYVRTSKLGIKLRIILEPGIDLSKVLLPEGPQYVIMAYNLYGYHSNPGPKADFNFIKKVASKLAVLPGDNNYLALATGGFDWSDDGKVAALNEKQAAELAAGQKSKTQRDKSSGAIHFEYTDINNIAHTVWYADGETLWQWINVSKSLGLHNIALWRLGGSSQQTLKKLITDGL